MLSTIHLYIYIGAYIPITLGHKSNAFTFNYSVYYLRDETRRLNFKYTS